MYRAVFNQNKIRASFGVGKSSFKRLSTTSWNFTTTIKTSTKSQVITEQGMVVFLTKHGTVTVAEPVECTFNLALKKLALKKKTYKSWTSPIFFSNLYNVIHASPDHKPKKLKIMLLW